MSAEHPVTAAEKDAQRWAGDFPGTLAGMVSKIREMRGEHQQQGHAAHEAYVAWRKLADQQDLTLARIEALRIRLYSEL